MKKIESIGIGSILPALRRFNHTRAYASYIYSGKYILLMCGVPIINVPFICVVYTVVSVCLFSLRARPLLEVA